MLQARFITPLLFVIQRNGVFREQTKRIEDTGNCMDEMPKISVGLLNGFAGDKRVEFFLVLLSQCYAFVEYQNLATFYHFNFVQGYNI